MTLNGGPAGQACWRAMFPIQKHEFSAGCTRDDHYPVCRLDIRQDSEVATGYGYPKTAFEQEPDTDPDIRNAFRDISMIQTFGKSCTLHNHTFFIIFRSIFSAFCATAMSPRLVCLWCNLCTVV